MLVMFFIVRVFLWFFYSCDLMVNVYIVDIYRL